MVARKEFRMFGTDADFQIIVESEAEKIEAEENLVLAFEMLQNYEKMFSRFDPESELSKINSQLGIFTDVSMEVLEIAKHSLEQFEKTEGFFDPRIIEILEGVGYDRDFKHISKAELSEERNVDFQKAKLSEDIQIEDNKLKLNSRMDFAGLVKGWAVDEVAGYFFASGWKKFLVDLGGDMYFSGKDESGKPWHVDIEGIDSQKVMLKLTDQAVATSGIGRRKWEMDGQRFHHLVDPKNPSRFLFELKSVTVIASKTEQADILAKTIFLMGKEGGMRYAEEKEIACAILDYRGNVSISPMIKNFL